MKKMVALFAAMMMVMSVSAYSATEAPPAKAEAQAVSKRPTEKMRGYRECAQVKICNDNNGKGAYACGCEQYVTYGNSGSSGSSTGVPR